MSGIQAFYQLIFFGTFPMDVLGKTEPSTVLGKGCLKRILSCNKGLETEKSISHTSMMTPQRAKLQSKTSMSLSETISNHFRAFYELTDSIPLICITRNTGQLNKSGMHRRAPNGENVSWRDAGKMLITYAKAHSGKARSPKADKKLNMHKAGG